MRAELRFRKNPLYPWNYLLEPVVHVHHRVQYFYERTPLRIFPPEVVRATLVQ